MRFPVLSVVVSGISLLAWGIASAQPSVSSSEAIQRVRGTEASLVALIRDAAARSSTFRNLVDSINASDGIVYVERGRCGHGVRACLVAVSVTPLNRIVRVKVDARTADWDLMGSIGHELRHAIEVLGDPRVTNTGALYFFYLREGYRGTPRAFETRAAVQAGEQVRREVRRAVLAAPDQ